MPDGSLAHLATPGSVIAIRVTPRAARNEVLIDADDCIRVYVTAPSNGGRATIAAQALLARALGVAKTRLVLIAGAASRDKRFLLRS